MFHWEVYEDGALFGVVYTFDKVGHGIAMHDHTGRDDAHNVIVLRGRLLIYGPSMTWLRFLKAGDIMELDPVKHNPHEIFALKSGTRTLHLYTQGRPANLGGNRLALEDRRGWTTMPPTVGSPHS